MVGNCLKLAIFFSQSLSHPVTKSLALQLCRTSINPARNPAWMGKNFVQYRQLLKYWDRVVNQQIAQHTRPLYINRQILYIATDSAARAQELSFQRYTLLKRPQPGANFSDSGSSFFFLSVASKNAFAFYSTASIYN